MGFKAIIVGIFIGSFALYRFIYPSSNTACINDVFHNWTLGANRPLAADPSISSFEGNSNQLTLSGKAFIGTGQVLMDLWIGIFGIIW